MTEIGIHGNDQFLHTADLWSDYPDWSKVVIEREGWQARPIAGLCQLMLHGEVGTACTALAPDAKEVGLWGKVDGETYLVRLARDRALLVSQRRVEADGAWQAEGWSASVSDDAFLVLELTGPAAHQVVSDGTSADLNCGSPSASVLFAEVTAALYRSGDDSVRIHVQTDMGPYLWRWLETRLGRIVSSIPVNRVHQ